MVLVSWLLPVAVFRLYLSELWCNTAGTWPVACSWMVGEVLCPLWRPNPRTIRCPSACFSAITEMFLMLWNCVCVCVCLCTHVCVFRFCLVFKRGCSARTLCGEFGLFHLCELHTSWTLTHRSLQQRSPLVHFSRKLWRSACSSRGSCDDACLLNPL